MSRPTIYKKIEELNIERKNNEFSAADYETLKEELAGISKANKTKRKHKPVTINLDNKDIDDLEDNDISTMRERLKKAKDQYNYNDRLISIFQLEIDEYVKKYNKTTMMTHNGTEGVIPAITSLDKYVRLNNSLSKLISELEGDLDLSEIDERDPFV